MKKKCLKYSSGELFEVFSNEKLHALIVITITIASLHFRFLLHGQGHHHPLHPTGSLSCPQALSVCPHQSPSLADLNPQEEAILEAEQGHLAPDSPWDLVSAALP